MPTREEALGREDLLWLLGGLCGIHRVPFDAALVAREYSPPYSLATLHRAARAFGFKTGECRIEGVDWRKFSFPAIAFLTPDALPSASSLAAEPSADTGDPSDTQDLQYPGQRQLPIVLVKGDGQRLLYFRAGCQTPETLDVSDVAERLDSKLILTARETTGSDKAEIPGFSAEKQSFGFRWFMSIAGIRHRATWPAVVSARYVSNVSG